MASGETWQALAAALWGHLTHFGRAAAAAGIIVAAAAAFAPSLLSVHGQTLTGRKTVSLVVEAGGVLPGFDREDVAPYLVSKMLDAGVEGWAFAPAQVSAPHAPNRVEWRFRPDPYAAGTVRQIVPIPAVQRLFGARNLVSVEIRLYLDGEYQTEAIGQVAIRGGDQDPELANFVTQQTENLLGRNGAYRSIDTGTDKSSPHARRDQ